MIANLLLGSLFVLAGLAISPAAYRAIKSGELRVRGGMIVRKEEQSFVFWASTITQAFVGLFLLLGGVAGVVATFAHH